MGQKARMAAEKLKQKYSRQFDVPLDQIIVEEGWDDEVFVYALGRPDLPQWSTGSM